MSHVFACLVHERPEVVADLVANLLALEPNATILLYDGSPAGNVVDRMLARDDRVVIHPSPRPMRWGRLHDFAIDSMRLALAELDFDALTIVDSDQLLIRPGYGQRVAAFLGEHPTVGMLGNSPAVQPPTSTVDPVRVAWREHALWRSFLDRLPGGSSAFPHWTFWPSTVFTSHAAADLVRLFDDAELQAILRRTRMFATEEIVLPTLVAALGYGIAAHPASYDFVRYRVGYQAGDVARALADPDAYWIHPVPRVLEDPVRASIRALVAAHPPPVPAATRPPRPPAPDMSAIRGGLDAPALLLLFEVLREATAVSAAGSRIEITARSNAAPLAIAAGDMLATLGVGTTIGPTAAARPGSVDVVLLDDERGLIDLAVALDDAMAQARPGGWICVGAGSIPIPKAAAVVRSIAVGAAAQVRQAGRAFAFRIPADVAGMRAAGSLPQVPPRRAPLTHLREAVARMVAIDGWFEPDEAALLATTTAASMRSSDCRTIVELGSFCGRATTVLGSVARHVEGATVVAVDRFDGVVGEAGRLHRCGPTLDRFRTAIAGANLGTTVREFVGAPSETDWSGAIALILVDGLHDYRSVASDFRHYEAWLAPGAAAAFHDYGTYPGVTRFVDELLRSGAWVETARLASLIVVRRQDATAAAAAPPLLAPGPAAAAKLVPPPAAPPLVAPAPPALVASFPPTTPPLAPIADPAPAPRPAVTSLKPRSVLAGKEQPLVSCLMPTFNRRAYVPDALSRFLAQDYPNRELIVVDDGTDPVENLMPDDPRVRYVRPPARMTIGAKRNLAAELAGGELLANWDDDDWVASWRLSYEVDALLGSEADVVGLTTLLYYEPASGRAWRYAYPRGEASWAHDPTLCLRRATWEVDRFPDSNYSLDTTYLGRGRRKRVLPLDDHRFYVGMIHAGNTSRKDTRGSRWRPTQAEAVVAMMAADAAALTSDAAKAGGRETQA